MEQLVLNDIRIDGQTQPRAAIDTDAVAEYAEAYQQKRQLPPLVVYHDGKDYWLADGFHRLHAARRAGITRLPCDVRKGTVTDARWHAAGANQDHGLRRTNADKRAAVEMALAVHPDWTDGKISEHVGVSVRFVGTCRPVTSEPFTPATRTGRDGKTYPAPTPKTPAAPAETPALPPVAFHPPPPAEPPPPAPREEKAPHGRDGIGRIIPDACAEVFGRVAEAKRLLQAVSMVRVALEHAADAKDPLFAEVNATAVLADLNRAYDGLTVAVPFAVCPQCQGAAKLTGCRLCSGRGAVSKFRYDTCVPAELKARVEKKA